jgi:DNA-binding MarR family transcriptional regulator
MQLQKITVGRHVERLVRSGWVERRDHATDARAYHLHLTTQAEPLIAKLTAVAEQIRGELMQGLAGARYDALMTDLLQIKSNLLRMTAETR